MELESMRRFVSVVDLGGVRAAAESLHVSPSSISRSVSQLEAELGAPLLDAQRERLTEAGRIALPTARLVLAGTDKLRSDVAEFVNRRDTVRVASCSPSPLWLLTDMLTRDFPATIMAGDVVATSAAAVQRLAAREADVAVTTEPISSPLVRSVVLMHERLLASVPRGTRLSRQRTCSFSDLAGMTVILYRGIGFWYDVITSRVPDGHFVVQPDRVVFLATTRSSDAVHFEVDVPEFRGTALRFANGMQAGSERRVLIPVANEEAGVTYYANWQVDARGTIRSQLDLLGAKLAARAARPAGGAGEGARDDDGRAGSADPARGNLGA